jgi:hypothetical protein
MSSSTTLIFLLLGSVALLAVACWSNLRQEGQPLQQQQQQQQQRQRQLIDIFDRRLGGPKLQPEVAVIDQYPSTKVFSSISIAEGTPWCQGERKSHRRACVFFVVCPRSYDEFYMYMRTLYPISLHYCLLCYY